MRPRRHGCIFFALVALSIYGAGCGGGFRAATLNAAEQGDVPRALHAYQEHRALNGDDPQLLAIVAQATLAEAALSGDVAEAAAAVRALGGVRPGTDEVLARIAAGARGVGRAAALAELGRRGRRCAMASLRMMIDDPDPEVRAIALSALSPERDEAALRAALDDVSAAVRRASVRRWGGRDTPSHVRHLLGQMARVDPSVSVRSAAVSALSRIGSEAFDLVNRALDDANLSVRMAAVGGVLRIDFQRGWLALQRVFAERASAAGVEAARRRLSHRGEISGMGVDDAEAYLLRALEDEHAAIRAQAAVALTSVEVGEEVMGAISSAVSREPDASARLGLARTLFRLERTRQVAREALSLLSLEHQGMVGLQAAVALAEDGDAGALRLVLAQRTAPDPPMRAVAFAALARALGRPDDARGGLEDTAWSVRVRTAGAIIAWVAHEG